MEMKDSQVDQQVDHCLRTVAVTVPQAENITSQRGNNHSPKDMEQVEGGARRKRRNAKPFHRNVYFIKNCDFRRMDGERYMPTLSEISKMRKSPSQFVKGVEFHPNMSRKMVMKKLEEIFPSLKNRSYSCASKTLREDKGNSRIWNGQTIKRNTQGNSALYILEDEIRDGLSSASENDFTSGVSGCDRFFTDDELPKFDYEVNINPQESPLKGGVPCHFTFSSALSSEVESVYATFFDIGTFKLRKGEDCYYCYTPAAKEPGFVSISLHGQKSSGQENVILGQTEICYVAPQPEEPLKKLVFDEEEQKKLFGILLPSSPGNSGNSGSSGSGGGTQINGAPGSSQQSRVLSLLIYAAAKYGAKRFIEMIFNSSAGRVVFDAYKDNEVFPESVAKDHDNEEIAIYLEEVTKRFSEETKNDEEFNHRVVDWSELIKATGEAQRKTDDVSYKEDMDELHGYSPDVELSSEASSKRNSPTMTFEDHVAYKEDMDELHGFSTDVELSSEASSECNSPTTTFEVPLEIHARGPVAVKAYNYALKDGEASVNRVQVILVGQERTGKTSLKRYLAEHFYRFEESTDGIQADRAYFKVSQEIWKTGEKIKDAGPESSLSFENLAAAKLTLERLRKETSSSQDLPEEQSRTATHIAAKETDTDVALSSPSRSNGSEISRRHMLEIPEEVIEQLKNLLQREKDVCDNDDIYLILSDFAEQSVYYDTHPIFLIENAIYLLVANLSHDPKEKATPSVKKGLYRNTVDSHSDRTNLDFLDFWMSSIFSLVGSELSSSEKATASHENLPGRLPPVFLVGTHADKPFLNTNARDQALEVFGFLRSKAYREHLFKDVFVVDNTKSGGDHECPEVVRLREKVLAVAKELPLMKNKIPLRWLKYESLLHIRMKRDKWIPLDEARRIAFGECTIHNEAEFLTLLNFLHDQRIVVHFSGSPELERMVILDPQWLVDVLKKIITVKRYEHSEKQVEALWLKLEDTGILDERLIDHAWRHLFDNQESRNSLIAIMERLSLLYSWPSADSNRQYLVPSMLMSSPTEDVLRLLDSVKIPSLFITFASGRVPPGLFSRLILLFLPWCNEEWNSKMTPQLFHNFAIFHILPGQGVSLIFRCHSSSIEILVYSGDIDNETGAKTTRGNIDQTLSRAIHWKLRLVLECMRKEFHWLKNVKYDMCVCCPVCSQPGSVKCHPHDVHGCECLHFLSESDLRKRQYCDRPGHNPLGDCRIRVKQFECWFSFEDVEESAGTSTNWERNGKHRHLSVGEIYTALVDCELPVTADLM